MRWCVHRRYVYLLMRRYGTCHINVLYKTFYNIPVDDPLTQTMSHFAGMSEAINDALGNANCLGSGYIMRRTALQAIGGFPTESLAEDVCCSATLLGAGWKTAFIPEAVQYGSVPDSYLGHIKQRTRWVSQGSSSQQPHGNNIGNASRRCQTPERILY